MNISPWIPCCNCNAPVIVEKAYTENYFNNEPFKCKKCGFNIDWWKIVNRAIRENFMLNQAFSVLEAKTNIIEVILRPNTQECINLIDNGIPKASRILYVNYTPQNSGGLFPLEIHGNVPHRRLLTDKIWLYPANLSKKQEVTDTKVSVLITWIEHTVYDKDFINLVDAFEAYSNDRLIESIIPANVAVESALAKLLSTIISKYVSGKKTKEFLSNNATYSSQLNVLLPLIINLNNLPILSDNIKGQLNKLRKYRNELAHDGKIENQLSKDDVADLLSTALFGFKYILFIKNKINIDKKDT